MSRLQKFWFYYYFLASVYSFYFISQNRNSVLNENGFSDGFIPTKTEKEQEGGKLLQNPMGNVKEFEYQKRDGTDIEQVDFSSSKLSFS